MANRVPWYVVFDWKNIIGGVSIVAIISLLVVIIFIPDLIQNNRIQEYHGKTFGTVTDIVGNLKMSQGHKGTNIHIGSYTVNYSYNVGGEFYNGIQQIKATPNSIRLLNKIDSNRSIHPVVKFDLSNPSRSIILIE